MNSKAIPGGESPGLAGPSVGVCAASASLVDEAARLAQRLGLPLCETETGTPLFELLLIVDSRGLTLTPTERTMGGGIRTDFVRGSTAFRRMSSGAGRQPLARAVGPRHGVMNVVDATAGLGRDSFQLASLGCNVMAVERSPVLFAMLSDALKRADSSGDLKLRTIVGRIRAHHTDAKELLPELTGRDRPDVVYLDPMYTPRSASALSKKEMRILRLLVGGDDDSLELLHIARHVATRRVIVKRHLRAEPLSDGVVQTHAGTSVRYDVYLSSAK